MGPILGASVAQANDEICSFLLKRIGILRAASTRQNGKTQKKR